MTPLHKARLGALALAGVTILMALSDLLVESGGAGRAPGLGAGATPGPGAGEPDPVGSGTFGRRNPLGVVLEHPPPAPPPTQKAAAPTPKPKPPPPPPKPRAPPKPLPLQLHGTIAAGPFGMAILGVQGKPQEAVAKGAELGEALDSKLAGWVLVDVRREAITLKKGDDVRVLELGQPQPKGTGGGGKAKRAPKPKAKPLPKDGDAASKETIEVYGSELRRAKRNLAFLVTQLSVQPYFDQGSPAGIRMSRIRPGSLIAKLGGRNGDVVREVNGQPVRTVKDAVKVYHAFDKGGAVSMKVLRGGGLHEIAYKIK